jgi:glycosyltransferase involved in cell wall biosynthesis
MEGLGTSVLDAMAAETPVVAAAGGGIPEMVEDGVSGLLVPPATPAALAGAIRRVLDEPELAGRLVEGGLARVRRFTADRMVEGTIAVYEAIRKGSDPTS